MDHEILTWLPDLILLEDFHGDWETYINAVYQHFYEDFIQNRTFFQEIPVYARYKPPYKEKGATFWHLISEGVEESERIPDLRRCERICWPRPMIQNINSNEVKVWETTRPWQGQKQRRINFALGNFSYIVVIAETSRGYNLVTAYLVERSHRRDKLRKEYETFARQKKGAPLFRRAPNSFYTW